MGGFKHALVSVLAAAVAARGRVTLRQAPAIKETDVLCALLSSLGARIERRGDELSADCAGIDRPHIDPALSEQIHGSIYLVPALLAAIGEVRFSRFGGCRIGSLDGGARPIEHMLAVLREFGAQFHDGEGHVVGRASQWSGAHVDVMRFSDRPDLLTGPLVSGATKTAIIAGLGVLEGGGTIVRHPYPKPDATQILSFAGQAGYRILEQADRFEIRRDRASPTRPVAMTLIPDLSQIMTYIALSVMRGVGVELRAERLGDARAGLRPELELLDEMGVQLRWSEAAVEVRPPERIRSVDIEVTSVGIYSDHQPFFALMLLKGDRPAEIREQVWVGRFSYARELLKLGAVIEVRRDFITVHPSALRPTDEPLVAADLRAAAALAVAACAVGAPTRVIGCRHLDRGYEALPFQLARLGAAVEATNGRPSVG